MIEFNADHTDYQVFLLAACTFSLSRYIVWMYGHKSLQNFRRKMNHNES